MAKRQNILFVIIDQLRADCVQEAQNSDALSAHVELPNLRGLAKDAVSFDNHVSVANPCGPSRASIMTGQYAMNHRSVRNGTPLAHDIPNIATEARKAGYEPLLFGYTDTSLDPRVHEADDPRLKSYEQVLPGFSEVLEMRMEESLPWRAHLRAKGYDVPPFPDVFRAAGDRPDAPAFYRAEDSDTAFLTDQVIADLADREQGWFAHVTYLRPHPPLVAPAPYNEMVDPTALPTPTRPRTKSQEDAMHPFNGPAARYKSLASNVEGFADLEDTDDNAATMRALYLGLAAEVDYHLGRILDFLRHTDAYENTLIVVTTDHGEMLGDFHLWGKMTYHDAAYRTPLIIRDPSQAAWFGSHVSAPTESVDIAPTILDLIGQNIPDTMDGQSLCPFLVGQHPASWRSHSFSELDFGNPITPTLWQEALGLDADQSNLAVLRSESHTLVHFNGGLAPLLFDQNSPNDGTDISKKPENQKILLEMSQAMLNHRMVHAEGRFARMMITSEGPVRGPRGAAIAADLSYTDNMTDCHETVASA